MPAVGTWDLGGRNEKVSFRPPGVPALAPDISSPAHHNLQLSIFSVLTIEVDRHVGQSLVDEGPDICSVSCVCK